MNGQPKSFPRILAVIANYGTANDSYLSRLVEEYRSMPFDVTMVVVTNVEKIIGPDVELRLVDLQGQDPWSLPFAHKAVLAEKALDYDLFIYSEDDVLITERNIRAFLEVSGMLPQRDIAGLFRFEEGPCGQKSYPDVHGHFHWDPESVRQVDENLVVARFTNEHSGCYLLTQEQLTLCLKSGAFLVEPHRGRYALPETAATDPYTQCGFEKVVCISRLDEFLVHHLPNKYVESDFGVDDQELRRQVDRLLELGRTDQRPRALFNTESNLELSLYSKLYYEPAITDMLSLIPDGAHTVLSLGSGWGLLETCLANKGLQVTTAPLDPIIFSAACEKGIEIVSGELDVVLRNLSGRQFDCVLLQHVLHLIYDPVETLRSVRRLLSSAGRVIISSPNMHRLPLAFKRLMGDRRFAGLDSFEKSRVHETSSREAKTWLAGCGMRPERIVHLIPPRISRLTRGSFGMLDSMLSSDFIMTALPVDRALPKTT